jgi:hypothetical protein
LKEMTSIYKAHTSGCRSENNGDNDENFSHEVEEL